MATYMGKGCPEDEPMAAAHFARAVRQLALQPLGKYAEAANGAALATLKSKAKKKIEGGGGGGG